jgi:hypothetical protein
VNVLLHSDRPKKIYRKPVFECFGTLDEITETIKGGPKRDGGTPPNHKQGRKPKS